MSDMTPEALLETAVAAARAAGLHALGHIDRRNEVAVRAEHDVKLQLDLECQARAEAVIRHTFPGHAIIGEEGCSGDQGAEAAWIIDPIDGTVNFAHTMPLWCSSVAACVGGEIVAGAVFAPALDEFYTAAAGGPARLNGEVIRPSTVDRLEDAMVLTGLSKKIGKGAEPFERFERLSRAVQKVRVMGAAAIDICHVACGRADAYVEASIYLWDVAAAGLIARRAGARTEVIEQYDQYHMHYLCTNGLIHDAIKTLTGLAS